MRTARGAVLFRDVPSTSFSVTRNPLLKQERPVVGTIAGHYATALVHGSNNNEDCLGLNSLDEMQEHRCQNSQCTPFSHLSKQATTNWAVLARENRPLPILSSLQRMLCTISSSNQCHVSKQDMASEIDSEVCMIFWEKRCNSANNTQPGMLIFCAGKT